MLVERWPNVCDAGPKLNQYCFNVSCLLVSGRAGVVNSHADHTLQYFITPVVTVVTSTYLITPILGTVIYKDNSFWFRLVYHNKVSDFFPICNDGASSDGWRTEGSHENTASSTSVWI